MPLRIVRRSGRPRLYLRGTVRGLYIFESTGTDSPKTAETIRAIREAELLDQSIFGRKVTTSFVEAVKVYILSGGSPKHLGREDPETGRWSGLIGHFGTTKLLDIGQAELDEAAQKLMPNVIPDTLNRHIYTPFIAVWNHAVVRGWAQERRWVRPNRKVKSTGRIRSTRPRAGTRPVDYPTAFKFVAALPKEAAMVMTALFYTGLRPIELFSIRSAEVFPDQQWLVIPTSKTGEPRGVPLHRFVVPLFAALKQKNDGLLFRNAQGKPYPVSAEGGGYLYRALQTARRETSIVDVSSYTARHTVSTQLVINGVHPHIKDQILGHAVTDMSRRYTQVPQAPLIEAINTLPVPESWHEMPWLQNPVAWTRRGVLWGAKTRDHLGEKRRSVP